MCRKYFTKFERNLQIRETLLNNIHAVIMANPTDGEASRKRPAKDDSAISAKRCDLWEHLFHCNIWTQARVTIQSPNFSHPAAKRLTSLWPGVACAPTLLSIVRMCTSAHKRPRKRKRQKHLNKPIPDVSQFCWGQTQAVWFPSCCWGLACKGGPCVYKWSFTALAWFPGTWVYSMWLTQDS